jgi:serine/threonine-protein kinase OSR1/STK39
VLVNTIKLPAPELPPDKEGKPFSKALRELVSVCLNKEPSKRPTAAKLLEHRFLKEAKKKEYLVKTLLEGTPPTTV